AEETQAGEEKKKSRRGRRGRGRGKEAEAAVEATAKEAAPAEKPQAEPKPERSKPTPPPEGPIDKITARARRGRALRGDADERATAPPILPGQAVKVPAAAAAAEPAATGAAESAAPGAAESKPARRGRRGRGAKSVAEPTPSKSNADATTMPAGLPTGREAIVAHLSGYKGVGVKSAEGLYDAFGESTFEVLRNERERVSEVLGPRRSATVLA